MDDPLLGEPKPDGPAAELTLHQRMLLAIEAALNSDSPIEASNQVGIATELARQIIRGRSTPA